MQDKNKKQKVRIVVVLLILGTIIQCIALGAIAIVKRENKVQDTYIYGQSLADSIRMTLDNCLEASQSLKYFYSTYKEECFDDFERFAALIAEDNPVIGSMYLAPGGVIRTAYPADVNEATIGFKMLEDPEQGPRAQLAIDTRQITVAGPHDLVEGGVGFIIRNPLFEDDAFIGFSIIVLDWDKFVQMVLANTTVSSENYRFAVWKDDHDEHAVTDDDGYIFRNSQGTISHKIDIEFDVPNDVWHLVVEPKDGWLVYKDMAGEILISIILEMVLISLIMVLVLAEERKRKLRQEIVENEEKEKYMQQLSEALEKAQKADAAKSDFLSRMSHDIRTPLNGIIGLMEINEKHAGERELVDANRKKARVAANHLLSLISDVLELSKLEDDNIHLTEEVFNASELLEDVLTITELRAAEHGVTLIHSDLSAAIKYPNIYGSPLHVRQVLLNIFSNAVKYNKPNGTVSYTLEAIPGDEHTVIYRMRISDTGIGMSPEFMKHMFDPFSQEHSDARSTYQGTGLGMAIVKNLVDKMGGTIEVTSKQGVGSTFTVTTPFRIAETEDVPKKVEAHSNDLSGKRLLLVEDNELNMEIAEMILSDLGAVITKAKNGREAVDVFQNNPPDTFDVILMDLMMPVMDGYAATRAIRGLDRADAAVIPIVAMTANAFAEDVRKCLETGMNGHIAKPLDIEVLVNTLTNL